MAGPRKFVANPNQIPLITPDSDWVHPRELPDFTGKKGTIALDVETKDEGIQTKSGAGWDRKLGYICGASVAWEADAGGGLNSVYASTRHPESENFSKDQISSWLRHIINNPDLQIVTQNGGYDYGWINADFGVAGPPGERMDDTQASSVMVDENRLTYNLDDLCKWRGVPGKDERLLKEAAAAYGVDPKGGLWRMPARYVGPYAAQDTESTLLLHRSLMQTVREEDTFRAYRNEVELMPMITEMRRRGVRLDVANAERRRDQLYKRRDELLVDLAYRLKIGQVTINNLDSPQWMERVFTAEGIKFERTEKSGQGSFKSDWMKKADHWLPKLCADISRIHMAGEKFIQGFLLDFVHRGRLHAEIHQFRSDDGGTRSHRFSYGNPPLQQMPARDAEIMPLVRGLFLPEEGELWGSCDYSQQEYRLMVHYGSLMGAPKVEEAVAKYRDNPKTDFHSLVAELTGLERKRAKDVNFATAFGAGVNKFALMTGMDLETAKSTMDQYNIQMPFIKALAKRCQTLAEKRGYVKLIDGARSHFDMWELAWNERGGAYEPPKNLAAAREAWEGKNLRRAYVHKAMNRLIQGSGARQMKMAMLQCWKEGLVPLLQIHDEVTHSYANEAQGKRVAEILESVITLQIPVVTDLEYGTSWGTAAKVEDKKDKKNILYGATWKEAERLRDEGPWWLKKAA